jgi:biopolymer transport protein ExbB
MNLTQKLLSFSLLGAEWVLWLLIVLSVISVAIMIERGLYFRSIRIDFEELADSLRRLLIDRSFEGARKKARDTRGVEAEVALAGLHEVERGPEAVAAAMMGAKSRTKLKLERNLAFLGTLGSNAPFIGLFGTVLGIIKAFRDLAVNQSGGISVVMAGISEALVATAVGLLVAIPAVVAFNFYNRKARSVAAHIDSLAHIILAEVRGETEELGERAVDGRKAKRVEAR